jgi:hypothetical protein
MPVQLAHDVGITLFVVEKLSKAVNNGIENLSTDCVGKSR